MGKSRDARRAENLDSNCCQVANSPSHCDIVWRKPYKVHSFGLKEPFKAAYMNNPYKMNKLLKKGTLDINSMDKYRRSSLHYAAYKGNRDVVGLLLLRGNRVQTDTSLKDGDGRTALFKAVEENRMPAVRELILKGEMDSQDNCGIGLLHYCAAIPNPQMLDIIVRYEPNLELRDKDGRTPIHTAVIYENHSCCSRLLAAGADVNSLDRYKRTPLFACCEVGNPEMIKLLLEHGCEPATRDLYGRTALEYTKQSIRKWASNIFTDIIELRERRKGERQVENQADDAMEDSPTDEYDPPSVVRESSEGHVMTIGEFEAMARANMTGPSPIMVASSHKNQVNDFTSKMSLSSRNTLVDGKDMTVLNSPSSSGEDVIKPKMPTLSSSRGDVGESPEISRQSDLHDETQEECDNLSGSISFSDCSIESLIDCGEIKHSAQKLNIDHQVTEKKAPTIIEIGQKKVVPKVEERDCEGCLQRVKESETIKESLDKAEQEIQHLRVQSSSLTEENAQMLGKLKSLEQSTLKLKKVENDYNQLRAQFDELKETESKIREENINLLENEKKLKEELLRKEEEVNSFIESKKLADLAAQNEHVTISTQTMAVGTASVYCQTEENMKDLEDSMKDLRSQLSSAEGIIKAKESKIKEQENQLRVLSNDSERIIKQLRTEIEEFRSSHDSEIEKNSKEIECLKTEYKKEQEIRRKKTQHMEEKMTAQIEDLTKSNRGLREQLQILQKEVCFEKANAEKCNKANEEVMFDLKKRYDSVSSAMTQSEEKCSRLTSELRKISIENESLVAKNEILMNSAQVSLNGSKETFVGNETSRMHNGMLQREVIHKHSKCNNAMNSDMGVDVDKEQTTNIQSSEDDTTVSLRTDNLRFKSELSKENDDLMKELKSVQNKEMKLKKKMEQVTEKFNEQQKQLVEYKEQLKDSKVREDEITQHFEDKLSDIRDKNEHLLATNMKLEKQLSSRDWCKEIASTEEDNSAKSVVVCNDMPQPKADVIMKSGTQNGIETTILSPRSAEDSGEVEQKQGGTQGEEKSDDIDGKVVHKMVCNSVGKLPENRLNFEANVVMEALQQEINSLKEENKQLGEELILEKRRCGELVSCTRSNQRQQEDQNNKSMLVKEESISSDKYKKTNNSNESIEEREKATKRELDIIKTRLRELQQERRQYLTKPEGKMVQNSSCKRGKQDVVVRDHSSAKKIGESKINLCELNKRMKELEKENNELKTKLSEYKAEVHSTIVGFPYSDPSLINQDHSSGQDALGKGSHSPDSEKRTDQIDDNGFVWDRLIVDYKTHLCQIERKQKQLLKIKSSKTIDIGKWETKMQKINQLHAKVCKELLNLERIAESSKCSGSLSFDKTSVMNENRETEENARNNTMEGKEEKQKDINEVNDIIMGKGDEESLVENNGKSEKNLMEKYLTEENANENEIERLCNKSRQNTSSKETKLTEEIKYLKKFTECLRKKVIKYRGEVDTHAQRFKEQNQTIVDKDKEAQEARVNEKAMQQRVDKLEYYIHRLQEKIVDLNEYNVQLEKKVVESRYELKLRPISEDKESRHVDVSYSNNNTMASFSKGKYLTQPSEKAMHCQSYDNSGNPTAWEADKKVRDLWCLESEAIDILPEKEEVRPGMNKLKQAKLRTIEEKMNLLRMERKIIEDRGHGMMDENDPLTNNNRDENKLLRNSILMGDLNCSLAENNIRRATTRHGFGECSLFDSVRGIESTLQHVQRQDVTNGGHKNISFERGFPSQGRGKSAIELALHGDSQDMIDSRVEKQILINHLKYLDAKVAQMEEEKYYPTYQSKSRHRFGISDDHLLPSESRIGSFLYDNVEERCHQGYFYYRKYLARVLGQLSGTSDAFSENGREMFQMKMEQSKRERKLISLEQEVKKWQLIANSVKKNRLVDANIVSENLQESTVNNSTQESSVHSETGSSQLGVFGKCLERTVNKAFEDGDAKFDQEL